MSKSLGNGIDPLEIIDSYGADSLRFSLVQGLAPGNDTRYTDQKTKLDVPIAKFRPNKIVKLCCGVAQFVFFKVCGDVFDGFIQARKKGYP
mgnify:CR=1 FL=1